MAAAISLNKGNVPFLHFIYFFMDSGLPDCQHLVARTLKHKSATYKEFFHISKLTDVCSWTGDEIA